MPPGRNSDIYAVILVGGRGKRLRPLSTALRPKAFLSVTKNRETMFRGTVDRILKLVDPGNIVVVANKKHCALVKRDLPEASWKNILLEPIPRNTAPAAALAARHIAELDRNAVMVVIPADHYVPDAAKETVSLGLAVDFLKRIGDAIVTIGIEPYRPCTEYGYIKVSKPGLVVKADRFVEKPDIDTAMRYIASGNYLWNSGIFILKVKTLLASLKRYAPAIFTAINHPDPSKGYDGMPEISLDYAIMEKARNMYCVKGRYGWSDVGSFDMLEKVLKAESRHFIKKCGKIIKIV